MKSFYHAAAVMLYSVLFALPPPAGQAETVRVGIECAYDRMQQNDLASYDIDVIKAVAEIINVELKYVCHKFDELISALLANKFDIIVSSLAITPERLRRIDFSIPYRVSIGRFVGSANRNFNLFDENGRLIPASFKGLSIGIEPSTTYHKWIDSALPGTRIQLYDSGQTMLLDLLNGRIDIVLTNPMKAWLEFLSKKEGKSFTFVSPPIDKPEYFGAGIGIGARKGQDALVERINTALESLNDNGSLETYRHKYFSFAIHPENWQNVTASYMERGRGAP